MSETGIVRCGWAKGSELDLAYHDTEWGVPRTSDAELFEALTLEGAQAGLSWSTILKKRDGYRRAFHSFDAEAVASMGAADVDALLDDPGVVRHRGKVESTLNNAARLLEVRQEFGSFSAYVWGFVDGAPVQNAWRGLSQLPSSTPASRALSGDLKKRGFRFVGPTTCYAFMQAVGMVNDHQVDCFRHEPVRRLGASLGLRRRAGA